ncbi:hypothetical protein [Thiolapillus sp.]
MNMRLPVLAMVFLLGACSDKQPEKPPEKHFNPWDTQMKALDKAKGLEKQMQQDAKDLDKQIREQGG